jgi:hypothetical protein
LVVKNSSSSGCLLSFLIGLPVIFIQIDFLSINFQLNFIISVFCLAHFNIAVLLLIVHRGLNLLWLFDRLYIVIANFKVILSFLILIILNVLIFVDSIILKPEKRLSLPWFYLLVFITIEFIREL